MTKIKISANMAHDLLMRQSPGGSGIWGNFHFFMDEKIKECHAWIVYDGFRKQETAYCPRRNTILITGEPPSVHTYHERYLAQFGTVITCHPRMNHPGVLHTQQALPWMIGGRYFKESRTFSYVKEYGFGYDDMSRLRRGTKSKLLSVILSRKTLTAGHVQRNLFIEKLKQRFGDDVDIFGVGFAEIEDKWDGLAAYRYHVAMENSRVEDYWTEKLSDAYLAYAYPFYYGCPNVRNYFPEGSLTTIDIEDHDKAISLIEKTIDSNVYDRAKPETERAREMVLNKYNVFPFMADICERLGSDRARKTTLRPESDFTKRSSLWK